MNNLVEPPSGPMARISTAELRKIQQAAGLRTVEHFVDLGSTNDRAMRLLAIDEVDLPALVVTDQQTAGRGRGSKSWASAPGALTFSLVLFRPLVDQPNRAGCIALTAGLAVCGGLRKSWPRLDVGMKWPNDIEVAGRKVCGILVEIPADHHRCVLGIGVNVNNAIHDADEPISRRASSLSEITGKSQPLHVVLNDIVLQTLRYMDRLDHEDPELPALWQKSCNLTGQHVRVESGSRITAGHCEGIASDGALLVRNAEGLQRCYSGSVHRQNAG